MKPSRTGTDMSRGFHATTVRRPVALLVAFVTLIVIGVIAYARIPLQMMPGGLQATRYGVWVNHPGSSAQENEQKVTRILEDQFRTLPDLKDLWSRSGDDSVYLRVSFNGDADLDLAKAELRDRIERARPQLPETVERINVWANDDGDPPIMFFALTVAERSDDTDFLIEEKVQRRLEAIDGVSRVQIWGMLDDSIRILLDEDKVRAAQLDIGNLIQRLSSDNFTQPLGEVTDGGRRFLLRSDMRFTSFDQVAEYPIGDGLRIGDVARVERVKTIRERLTRIDGEAAYWGIVQKEGTGNVVAIAERIHAAIADIDTDPALAGQFKLNVFFDQAKFIQNSLNRLRETALWGGGLAILVLFLFLRRLRMTLCVALAIPVSSLLSIAYEYFTGGSFNVLTMTGLTLGIGMLVDNSVVVIENIARLRAQGRSGKEAAVEGVRDVGLAIALATLTSVVVFLPLIFMGKHPMMRVMLGALGLPLCTSLLFSLLVALVFLPVITSRILGARPAAVTKVGSWLEPIAALPVRALAAVIGTLRAAGHFAMVALFWIEKGLVKVLTPLRWILALGLIALAGSRVRFLPELQGTTEQMQSFGIPAGSLEGAMGSIISGIVLAVVAAGLLAFGLPRWRRRASAAPARPTHFAPRGTSILAWLQDGNRALLGWTLDHRMLASLFSLIALLTILYPQNNMTMAAFGNEEDTTQLDIDIWLEDNFTFAEASAEMRRYEELLEDYREEFEFDHIVSSFSPRGGEVELRWADRQDPEYLEELRERLRTILPKYAGHEVTLASEQQIGNASRQFVWFELRGTSAEALEQYGREAMEILQGVPGLTDVTSSLETSPEQVRLVLDPEASHTYGVTADMALRNVAWVLRGQSLPRYHEEGREVPFIMEYDTENYAGLDTLRDLQVFTGEGVVPLSSFAEITFERGRRQIRRYNGQTTFHIQARLEDPNRQLQAVDAGYTALEQLDLPRGFSLGRDSSVRVQQEEEMQEMKNALLLSIVLVFLLMGILFESLLLPVSVLTTIPFAYLGAIWTLYLTGTVMDSVGMDRRSSSSSASW